VKHIAKRPNLYIIAGPNGAGKTTFAKEFLPNYVKCREFVNADLIAGGLSPFAPERAAIQAGRIMLKQIYSLGNRLEDFGFETTLSGKMHFKLLTNLKDKGYRIHLYFLWIPSVDLALERIAGRVRNGGHQVPEGVVRRRFNKGLINLFNLYRPILDFWAIYDNSEFFPKIIAFEKSGLLQVVDRDLFEYLFNKLERK